MFEHTKEWEWEYEAEEYDEVDDVADGEGLLGYEDLEDEVDGEEQEGDY